MSNVLIGIIGVILFIGLALAGALFLGPRFQESKINSDAAAAIQAVSQVSNAVNLYEVNEGREVGTHQAGNLISGGYLKSFPAFQDKPFYMLAPDGCAGCASPDSIGIVIALSNSADDRALCAAVMRQVGDLQAEQSYDPPAEPLRLTIQRRAKGCAYDGANNFIYSRF